MTTNESTLVEKLARAMREAECPGREGPFGGYDYGHNTDFYGPEPEGGRYVVRDFRDPSSPDWGKWVHQTHDCAEHERALQRLTDAHVVSAVLRTLADNVDEGMLETFWEAQEDGKSDREALTAALRHHLGDQG